VGQVAQKLESGTLKIGIAPVELDDLERCSGRRLTGGRRDDRRGAC